MAQLCDQADFTKQGLVIPFAVYVGQRYLQGHPDALDSIPGLPDLAASTFAEVLCQPVLAQSLAGFEIQTRRTNRLGFSCISRTNHIFNKVISTFTILAHIITEILEINFKKIAVK
jgi:hypothetical protein